jgi:Na+-transporting methylmalonyl-CoA/oxaloacetate decarboxylase gamma subunit
MKEGECMDLALSLTFSGIAIVFGVLIMLIVLIKLLSFFVKKITESLAKDDFVQKAGQENVPAASEIDSGKIEQNEPEQDNTSTTNEELIAVLTAAVAASMQAVSTSKIKIKSFRRIQQTSPVWNKAGRIEHMSSRL